jgi:hypothetical protein
MLEESCRTARDMHGNAAPIRMTWPGFRDAMIAASQRINEGATTGSAGYGAAAVTDHADHDHAPATWSALHAPATNAAPGTPLANAIAAAVAVAMAAMGNNATPAAGVQRTPGYCFTHSYCFHTGKDCRHKGTGHKDEATTHVGFKGSSTKGNTRN